MKFSTAVVALLGALAGTANAEGNDGPAPVPRDEIGGWPVLVWHPSGYIKLGINDEGSLNLEDSVANTPVYSESGVRFTGLRYIDKDNVYDGSEFESTSPGCLCEGFGVAFDRASGTSRAYANRNSGNSGIAVTGDPALDLGLHSAPECMDLGIAPANCQWAETKALAQDCLLVEHKFHPSTKSDLAFKVDVVLTNICDEDITGLRYQRSMDWDIEPTPFREKVLLNPGTAVDLQCLHDNGFCSGDPDDGCPIGRKMAGCASPGMGEIDSGDGDHGATFRFVFQDISAGSPLSKGQSKSFVTYYGAGKDYDEAKQALADLMDVEAYSIGISDSGPSPAHFFGFAGIGGDIVTPPIATGYVAPCECDSTQVSSDGTTVQLSFDVEGPYNAECA